ncbi:MAG: hypothetical protein O3A20_09045 [Planctomycetota bacterium]|nr:hypothetical protein [Planctomycetota bacterium]
MKLRSLALSCCSLIILAMAIWLIAGDEPKGSAPAAKSAAAKLA